MPRILVVFVYIIDTENTLSQQPTERLFVSSSNDFFLYPDFAQRPLRRDPPPRQLRGRTDCHVSRSQRKARIESEAKTLVVETGISTKIRPAIATLHLSVLPL